MASMDTEFNSADDLMTPLQITEIPLLYGIQPSGVFPIKTISVFVLVYTKCLSYVFSSKVRDMLMTDKLGYRDVIYAWMAAIVFICQTYKIQI